LAPCWSRVSQAFFFFHVGCSVAKSRYRGGLDTVAGVLSVAKESTRKPGVMFGTNLSYELAKGPRSWGRLRLHRQARPPRNGEAKRPLEEPWRVPKAEEEIGESPQFPQHLRIALEKLCWDQEQEERPLGEAPSQPP